MTPFTSGAATLIYDPDYADLKRYIIASTGLSYYSDKDNDFAIRLNARVAALGCRNCREYFSVLTDSRKGEVERHQLIAQLTIGETYFFRHSEQFDALRDMVFPELIQRNESTRTLRIWSAGCSTGAEPYSMAILLKQEFGHRLINWDVRIIATDINQDFLASASHGRFESWAMRATPDYIKDRWFVRDGKSWVLIPEARERITFQYHNLVEHPFPSLAHGLVALDLIVCRNVMIYFDWDLIRRIIASFYDCLSDGGWLIVGHAESNVGLFRRYRTVNVPGTTLYQKDSKRAGTMESPLPYIEPLASPTTVWTPPELPSIPESTSFSISIPSAADDGVPAIRRLADAGHWSTAIEECDRLLGLEPLNPSLHFLRALILEQTGKSGESERALRRAIYLDRNYALAHYHLGLLLQKRGDMRSAVQSLGNAQRILERMDKKHVFHEADGMTVNELEDVIAMQMGLLRR